jgi:5-formyltetrahydrofolate cyclo-ligase
LPPGRFGIRSPAPPASALPFAELDVVLVPLVAFDRHGTRIGMGGGYYDRGFAFRIAAPPPPFLVGLAYHWQLHEPLDRRQWDVPLDAVITDRAVHRFD